MASLLDIRRRLKTNLMMGTGMFMVFGLSLLWLVIFATENYKATKYYNQCDEPHNDGACDGCVAHLIAPLSYKCQMTN
jgi:hypothetical protein